MCRAVAAATAVSSDTHLKSPDAEDMEERKSIFSLHLPPSRFHDETRVGATREMHFRVFPRRSTPEPLTSYRDAANGVDVLHSTDRSRGRRRRRQRRFWQTTPASSFSPGLTTEKRSRERLSRVVVVVEISFARLLLGRHRGTDLPAMTDMWYARLTCYALARSLANGIPLSFADEKWRMENEERLPRL